EGGVVAGELEAEGRGLGMDAVAAADGRRQLVLDGAPLQGGEQAVEIPEKNIRGLGELHGEAGVEHVRRGHALMDEARGLADMLGQVGEEGDDVVLHRALDGIDAVDLELALGPDGLGRRFRDQAEGRHGVAGMGLDLEPDAEAVLRLPDLRHLRAAVAGDHAVAGPVAGRRRGGRARSGNPIDHRSSPWPSSAQSDSTATRPSIRRRRPPRTTGTRTRAACWPPASGPRSPTRPTSTTPRTSSATSWRAVCGSPTRRA